MPDLLEVEDSGEETEEAYSDEEGTDEDESHDSPPSVAGSGVRQVRGDVNRVTPPLISGGQGLVPGHVHPPGHPLPGPGPSEEEEEEGGSRDPSPAPALLHFDGDSSSDDEELEEGGGPGPPPSTSTSFFLELYFY